MYHRRNILTFDANNNKSPTNSTQARTYIGSPNHHTIPLQTAFGGSVQVDGTLDSGCAYPSKTLVHFSFAWVPNSREHRHQIPGFHQGVGTWPIKAIAAYVFLQIAHCTHVKNRVNKLSRCNKPESNNTEQHQRQASVQNTRTT